MRTRNILKFYFSSLNLKAKAMTRTMGMSQQNFEVTIVVKLFLLESRRCRRRRRFVASSKFFEKS